MRPQQDSLEKILRQVEDRVRKLREAHVLEQNAAALRQQAREPDGEKPRRVFVEGNAPIGRLQYYVVIPEAGTRLPVFEVS